jgi:hypothetical protein
MADVVAVANDAKDLTVGGIRFTVASRPQSGFRIRRL